jgi:uncharacterized protein YdhG (YjbR/CyaY superfamily)
MRREASSSEAYRSDVSGPQRAVLEAIRGVIFEAVPEIRETLGHGMLDYPGLANLGAQKRHVSLYVAPAVLARWRDRFSGVSAGKSCLRFERIEQVDREALTGLLREVRAFRRGERGRD